MLAVARGVWSVGQLPAPGDVDTGTVDTSTTDATTGTVGTCPDSDACAVDWDNAQCGVFGSSFDQSGCLYPPCSLELDCPDDGVCVYPQEWGLCASSSISCSEANGVCECVSDDDCGGHFCMPADTAPPVQCNLITDETECVQSGCREPLMVRQVTAVGGGSCLCDLEVPQCYWASDFAFVGIDEPTAYYNWLSAEVFVFPWSFSPAPPGWIACDDLLFPTPECECAAMLLCAM